MSSAALIARVKNHCSTRGIDVSDEFKYIDRKKTGFIPDFTFRRFFNNINFSIGEQQFSSLVKEFSNESGLVDVHKFVEAVEKAEKLENIQTTDASDIVMELTKLKGFLVTNNRTLRELFRPYDVNFKGFVSQNGFFRELGYSAGVKKIADKYTFDPSQGVYYSAIEKDLKNLSEFTQKEKPDLTTAANTVFFKGYDVGSAFSQFDKFRTGRLSPEAFASVVYELAPKETTQITNFYKDCDGLCDAKLFYKDLMNQTQTIQQTRAMNLSMTASVAPPPDPEEVADYLKKTVSGRHIKISNYIDPMEKTMTRNAFISAIEALNVGLSRREIEAVADANEDGEFVNVQKFLGNFAEQPPKLPEVPVEEIRDFLRRTHQRITPYCQRVDRNDTGEIDIYDLSAIMSRLGFGLNRTEADAIARVFKGREKMSVYWKVFAMAVEPKAEHVVTQEERIRREEEKEQEQRAQQRKRTTPFNEEIIPILQKINTEAEKVSANIFDELREVDSLHCGVISRQQLYDAISFIGLSPAEFSQLYASYPDGRYSFLIQDLNDPRSQPVKAVERKIDDKLAEVLSQLKGVLSTRSISILDVLGDRFPTATRASALLSRYTPNSTLITDAFRDKRRPELVNTMAIQEAVENAVAKKKVVYRDNKTVVYQDICVMRQKFDARHIRVRRLFAGCDKFIPFEEFIKRIESANIIIDGRQIERLQRRFETSNGVEWEEFAKEIDEISTITPVE